jgi:cell division protease FtsH
MKFSFLCKKSLAFLLLFSLSTSSLHPQAITQGDSAVTPEDAERIMSDPQVVKQLQAYVVQYQIPAIFSKIESLKLVLSNNGLKLNGKEKTQLLTHLSTAKTVLEENITFIVGDEQHPLSDKSSIIAGLAFCKQLINYVSNAIKDDFKKMVPFSFTYQPEKEYTAKEIVELFKEVILQFEQLELSFNEIGNSKPNKTLKKLGAILDRYGIWPKTKLVSLGIFLALFARYLFKDAPRLRFMGQNPHNAAGRFQATRRGARRNSAPPSALPDVNSFHQPLPPRPDAAPAQRNFLWRWLKVIDDNIVGTQPISFFDIESQKSQTLPGTGKGLFGHVHAAIEPLTKILAFPVTLAALIDRTGAGINGWKSLNSNPGTFFKLEEFLQNKQQKVSAIDEFFLSSAIEHTAPRLTFDDIAGLEEQKKELQPVINYLLNPEIFEKTGTTIEKGYLLYGPTRTGKTHFAEALAGEIVLKHKRKCAFIKIRASELRLVGIKKVLDMVGKYAPCIVFIDEIDLLNLQRDHNTTLLEEFLTSMKLDTGNHQVIFLAATNRIDHIDHALLQPGRFGKIIPFENPSQEDRLNFFEKHLSRKNMYDPELLDMNRLVQETEGCSFGDLASITNNALALSTQNRETLSYKHFDMSIDAFKHKIAESSLNLPAEERVLIATHLAGHALAYHLLATGEQLNKVTMLPIQKKIAEENIWLSNLSTAKKVTCYGDVFTLHKANTSGFDTPKEKGNRIKALLAGHVAEKILLGSCGYGYHNDDYEHARQIAESLVFQGLKKDHFSREGADKKLDEVMKLLSTYEAEVTTLLQENKDKLQKLADALNKYVTLTAEDVAVLLK